MEKAKLTKNLKLKIKNAQLTKAAGLDKLKQKLAQAGSSDTKNSPASKAQTKEKSSKKTAGTPAPAPEVDLGATESTARRIRAKDRSSFAAEPTVTTALPGDASHLTLDAIPAIKAPEITSVTQKEQTLRECTDTSSVQQEEKKESSEETSPETPERIEETPIIRTRTEPKSVVSIKPKFGPTGKHINHLLAKTFKAPAKETKAASTEETTQQQPRQNDAASHNNKQQPSGTSSRPASSAPSYRRESTSNNNNNAKRGSERDRSKRSDESVKAFTGRDRYGLNEGSSKKSQTYN